MTDVLTCSPSLLRDSHRAEFELEELSSSESSSMSMLSSSSSSSSSSSMSSSRSLTASPTVKAPVVVDLTNQSYWGWFLGWKIRSIASRVSQTFSEPVPFDEFDLVPDEIWLEILSYLSSNELADLACVCRQFARLCRDRVLKSRFELVKLAPMSMAQLALTPVAVMLVGDHHIGKTRLATAFLTDSCTGPRQGFGTRCFSHPRFTAPTAPKTPGAAPRFSWFPSLGAKSDKPDAAAVFGVSLFDVANAAVAPKRDILAFPMLCHAVAVAFAPTDQGIAGLSEWIDTAHRCTNKERAKLGWPAKAPVLLLCVRSRAAGAAPAPLADGTALRELARTLATKHGVAVQVFDVDPFTVSNVATIDKAFGASIALMQADAKRKK